MPDPTTGGDSCPWPICDRAGCFDRTMVPVPGLAADLFECPLCGAMADTAPPPSKAHNHA